MMLLYLSVRHVCQFSHDEKSPMPRNLDDLSGPHIFPRILWLRPLDCCVYWVSPGSHGRRQPGQTRLKHTDTGTQRERGLNLWRRKQNGQHAADNNLKYFDGNVWNSVWETTFLEHSPENRGPLYVLYKVPLTQANFLLAQLKKYSHWRAGEL